MEDLGRYTLLSKLNDGDKIKIALDKTEHDIVACKVFNRKEDDFMSIEEEIRIQERMNHPFIAPIKDIVYSRENIYVIMKYYKQGDLLSLLQSQMLGMRESIRIFSQIVEAVCYLHTRGVAHLDIKPENIFIDEDFNAILADFGCCETEESRKRPYKPRGTLMYAAPEVFSKNEKDHRPMDIWSLGILLFLLMAKHMPWVQGSENELLVQVLEGDIGDLSEINNPYKTIIYKCCKKCPKERITIDELKTLLKENDMLEDTYFNINRMSVVPMASKLQKPTIVRPNFSRSTYNFSIGLKTREYSTKLKLPILNKSLAVIRA